MGARPRVGVRELRQNLSVYLRRTLAGETLEVTERGRPVALLTPVPERADAVSRLVADGRARPATRDFRDLGPPIDAENDVSISDALEGQREDKI
jgi:prevent-host-death family protein